MAPGPDPSFGVVGEGAGLLAREGKGAPGERRIDLPKDRSDV